MDQGTSAVRGLRRAVLPGLAIALGGGGAFLLMANAGQVRHGSLIGAIALAIGIAGLLRALGMLRADPDAVPLSRTSLGALPGEPAWTAPRLWVPAALGTLVVIAAVLGGAGLPWAIAAALLLLLPPALRRPGLLVFVLVSALYLPLLGVYGLWDPWETHYGEVAREILARDDWLSLWWAQDRWFWSKPIFIFWAEALLWSASGLDYLPDTNVDHAEWVLRLPTYAIAIASVLAVNSTVGRLWSRRAGLLAALVLATMPYYALLTRQAITDLPFVGTMTIAVMLLLRAVHEDPARAATRYRLVRGVSASAQELVLGAFLLLALPQVLYLASRNITFIDGLFAWHGDEFLYGSGHNPDVPGNVRPRDDQPRYRHLLVQPLSQALWFSAAIAIVVARFRRERGVQALTMLGFYLVCALSFMAKGLPGFALPGLVALLYLWACRRWPLLLEGRLKVGIGALALCTVGLPWFVAMYVRHGAAFTNRLLVHDHINRLAKGVHGDTGSIQYFIEQLGYGTFPWIALAPLALGSWLWPDRGITPRAASERDAAVVVGLWFAAAFTLFSVMITKFHHYILPAVPPAAILIGTLLDRMLGAASEPAGDEPRPLGARWPALALALAAPLPLVLGAAGLRGDVRGVLPEGLSSAERAVWVLQHPWPGGVCAALIGLGVAGIAAAAFLDRRDRPPSGAPAPPDRTLAAGLLGGAVLAAFVGRDLSWTTAQRPAGNERLLQLFVYNYDRPWPEHLDYRAILGGFAIVAVALVGLCAIHALRPVLTRALVGVSLAFTLFLANVYLIDLSPHWSQRDLVKRYYRERASADEPFVAWQMNWKGENFYTGNRVAVFVSLNNEEIERWLDQNEGKRAFFVLEHKRLNRFKTLLGRRKVKELTTERDNNKFVLVEARI